MASKFWKEQVFIKTMNFMSRYLDPTQISLQHPNEIFFQRLGEDYLL